MNSEFEIKQVLSSLGIEYLQKANSKGWLPILCPKHNDKNFGSCSINVGQQYNGVISCLAGCESFHLTSIIMERLSCNYFDALEVLKTGNTHISRNLEKRVNGSKLIEKNNEVTFNFIDEIFLTEFDPKEYKYTLIRGFSEIFCKVFGIKKICDHWYKDYIYIPVCDKKQNIQTFEARKLLEEEYLRNFFSNRNDTFFELRNKFKEYKKQHNLKYKKDQDGIFHLWKNQEIIEDNETLIYLLKAKVLYPTNSKIYKTIFNVDSLNRDDDLWLVEGTGSIAKIWFWISKNVSCVFGVNISEEQIEILKQFKKRIIVIPDNDDAGLKMVKFLSNHLNNVSVLETEYDDTDRRYVSSIRGGDIVYGKEFILDKLNIFPEYN